MQAMNNAVIEIDGVKITPEFISLIKKRLYPVFDNVNEFKAILFDAQVGIMAGIASDACIPGGLSGMNHGLQNLYYFLDEISDLRKEGKV